MENTSSWGVEQVWGSDRFYHEGDVAEDMYAFVVDSGVSLDTNDLNINHEWSKSFTSNNDPFDDASGHGTAVASVIGAKADYKGLTGVAPGAQIVSLKVFDGPYTTRSRVIAAIEYAGNLILENNLTDKSVINLSLGARAEDAHPIIRTLAQQGVRFAVSAGNGSIDVDTYSPAGYGDEENVYTVSANDKFGKHSGFTNFDGDDANEVDDVDFSAPGTQVRAYATDGSLRLVNGTSFSAPHVAGLLLMSDIKAGQTFELSNAMREAGADSDPLAMFDESTYKHRKIDPKVKLKGTSDDDVLTGGNNNDRFKGLKGNDTLTGNQGDDLIRGGKGDDILSGGSGNDFIIGGKDRNIFKSERDGNVDILATRVDKNSLKADVYEGLDSFDRIMIQDAYDFQISVSQTANGIGIFVEGILEGVYMGGTLTVEEITDMTFGTK